MLLCGGFGQLTILTLVLHPYRSPFLVNLKYAFQTEKEMMLVMPFMAGGDLHYYLDTRGRMSERECKFYAAELVRAC